MGKPAPLGVASPGVPALGDVANTVLSGVLTGIGPTQPIAVRGPMNAAIYASLVDALTFTAGSLSVTAASATSLAVGQAITSALAPPGSTIAALAGTTITLGIPPITLRGRSHVAPLSQIHSLESTAGLLNAAVSGLYIPAGTTVTGIIKPGVAPYNDIPNNVPGLASLGSGVQGQVQLSQSPTAEAPNPLPLVPFTFLRTGNAITAGGVDNAASVTGVGITFVGSVQLERSFDGGSTWIVCNIGGAGTLAVFSAGTPVSVTFGEPEREVLYRWNCTAYTSGNINYRISTTGQGAESVGLGLLA